MNGSPDEFESAIGRRGWLHRPERTEPAPAAHFRAKALPAAAERLGHLTLELDKPEASKACHHFNLFLFSFSTMYQV